MRSLILSLVVALSACASAQTSPSPQSRAIVSPALASAALIGRFDNVAQFAAAPDALKRAPAAGFPYEWLDEQHAAFTRVTAPAIGADVLYVEWKRADGSISRQRIWSFRRDDQGRMRMDYFSFRSPESYAGKGDTRDAFAALTPADLIGYGPDCALIITPGAQVGRWDGQISEDICQITGAASGRRMGLRVRLEVNADGLTYAEAGLLADGSYAFKVPGGPPYAMQRR